MKACPPIIRELSLPPLILLVLSFFSQPTWHKTFEINRECAYRQYRVKNKNILLPFLILFVLSEKPSHLGEVQPNPVSLMYFV